MMRIVAMVLTAALAMAAVSTTRADEASEVAAVRAATLALDKAYEDRDKATIL